MLRRGVDYVPFISFESIGPAKKTGQTPHNQYVYNLALYKILILELRPRLGNRATTHRILPGCTAAFDPASPFSCSFTLPP